MTGRARRRSEVETADYADMIGRMIRAYGRRLGDTDSTELGRALELRAELDKVIGEAVATSRTVHGWSWAQIAQGAGITRQAAQQRWGRDA